MTRLLCFTIHYLLLVLYLLSGNENSSSAVISLAMSSSGINKGKTKKYFKSLKFHFLENCLLDQATVRDQLLMLFLKPKFLMNGCGM